MSSSAWPLLPSLGVLAAMAVVIVVVGVRLTRVADTLAERTGLGDAIGGALLLGAVTSLPGNVTVLTGALEGDPGFALANPVGGIALQTVWLAIADLLYRRVNLEHAAASLQNVLQSVLLIAMLAIPVIAYATPDLRLGWIHPLTLLIPALYGYGLVLLRRMQHEPMWQPKHTDQTADGDGDGDAAEDEGDGDGDGDERSTARLWGLLAALGLVTGVAGWLVGRAGLSVIARTNFDSGVFGFTLTTAISSLPELVVLLTAVRMGQLTLGVGNIVGGNVYDILMISLADVGYLEGPIYRDAGPTSLILVGGTLLMTAVLAAGLIMRDRKWIGFEGISIPLIYVGTVVLAVAG
ncbi:sodium:calcium symporter [Blastococcus sp. BMG 814]|uniref:Sodium:calcium symporter n=1 Tax=Blastococcus carthaginiensis TaxID=3050034 RepID=A0ABT9I7I9_9ACTN|nr:sodium:calcium symporter [Blastococcus carthaginiensis]MDP5181535.1 sodium:calcium symporter [Blastococcus carthaginiensis]